MYKRQQRSIAPQLIAVSKRHSSEAIADAVRQGLTEFGENYVQEALEKMAELSNPAITWHFIGPIQSNKTRSIAEHFAWVHSVDREKIARRLNDQRPSSLPALNVCLQVNMQNEDSKSGVSEASLLELAQVTANQPNLKLRGLMFIPAKATNYQEHLKTCHQARALFDMLQHQYPEIDTLSLGMSADLEAAIHAGSTMVRIGTDIFGARS